MTFSIPKRCLVLAKQAEGWMLGVEPLGRDFYAIVVDDSGVFSAPLMTGVVLVSTELEALQTTTGEDVRLTMREWEALMLAGGKTTA